MACKCDVSAGVLSSHSSTSAVAIKNNRCGIGKCCYTTGSRCARVQIRKVWFSSDLESSGSRFSTSGHHYSYLGTRIHNPARYINEAAIAVDLNTCRTVKISSSNCRRGSSANVAGVGRSNARYSGSGLRSGSPNRVKG